MTTPACFKAYDIRGRVPDDLNAELAYRIGQAYAQVLRPSRVILGRDVRLTSQALCGALETGLRDAGVDIFDIGLCGTEEVYFATAHLDMDGGIMVTASHNPMDYNGMKLVREGSRPISGDSGLSDIQARLSGNPFRSKRRGRLHHLDGKAAYVAHLLTYAGKRNLKPLRIVANPGNGCAGPVIKLLERTLPFEFIQIHDTPDGRFPNGIPNPLLPENRGATARAVRAHGADMGIAWDGDFDRCFLFDETGAFVEGYYIVGLLAQAFLEGHPGEKIVHDPRLTRNTIDIAERLGGVPVEAKTGHAFIKERMRAENAIYGGEMSAHHYFRDFAYCDSGMIPWLLVAALVSRTGVPLSEMVGDRIRAYPCSGELNFRVPDPGAKLREIERLYDGPGAEISRIDGLSMAFTDWRFNLRSSNTEPLLRLNVETRGDHALMQARTAELKRRIEA